MTIKYELNGSGGTDSDCTPAVGNNERAVVSQENASSISRSIPAETTDEISLSWTTLANNPNVADWPNGQYTMTANVTLLGANSSVQWQLHRVNSSCTSQETIGTSGDFSTTGVHTFNTTVDPAAGNAADRFQGRVLGTNTAMHGSETFTIGVITPAPNAFLEGPWTTGHATPKVDAIRVASKIDQGLAH